MSVKPLEDTKGKSNMVPFPTIQTDEKKALELTPSADPVIQVRELESEVSRRKTKVLITTSGFPLPPFGVPMNRVENRLAA